MLAAAQGSVAPGRGPQAPRGRPRPAGGHRAPRAKELQSDLDKIAAERERINARLVETAKLIQQSEAQLSLIESRLGELEAQEKHLRESLESRHGSISALLAAMQRMGRNPPPVMVTRREDALSMVRSAMLLASAFPELRSQAVALSEQLNDLVRVMTSIRTEGDKLRAETSRLNDARMRLAGAAGGEAPVAGRAAGRAGAGAPGRSRDLKERRRPERSDLQARQGGCRAKPGSAPTRRRLRPPSRAAGTALEPPRGRQAAAGAPPASAAATASPPRSATSVVLAPSGDRVAMLTPGRIKPAIPFPTPRACCRCRRRASAS